MKKNDAIWLNIYEKAKIYFETYGNLEVPREFKTNDGATYDQNGSINLGTWIQNQRRKCDPESERGQLLLKIGMRFETRKRSTMTWFEMYEIAKLYFEKYGNLEIPSTFKTSDGITYDSNGSINLGAWIFNQRRACNPESEQGQLLSKIGMRFQRKNLTWFEMYEIAKLYFEKYGDLEISCTFKTEDGIHLGIWVFDQRKRCNPESERGQLLSKIGMRFETKKKNMMTWEQMYELAKLYFEKYGNLEIPSTFKTEDGINFDKNGSINLGMWLAKQRKRCNPQSERGQLLSKIGIRFETKKKNMMTWEQMYELAKLYFERYGNLDVSTAFKTEDGINYDSNGRIKLGAWVYHQKINCDPESERGQLLSKIGMKFDNDLVRSYGRINAIKWLKMYRCAVLYYEKNGHLDVSKGVKDENELALANWLSRQKFSYKKNSLSSEKIYMLEAIGIVWDAKINRINIVVLCDENNINIEKNKNILKHISFTDFKVKLSYLKNNGINIVDENGLLHEIFSMSGMNMKLKYGVSLEDLVNMHNKVKTK